MPLNIVSYAYGRAANNFDTELGPGVVKNSLSLQNKNLSLAWLANLSSESGAIRREALGTVAQLNRELAQEIHELVSKKLRFLTLGGDHSCAIGTWSGAASALKGPLGLIWVDAHLDSHTPENSITQNIHGMPLAVLLGAGNSQLTQIQIEKAKILPENLVLIGARNFEESEHQFLESLGVRIFYMPDIEKEGLKNILEKSVKIASSRTAGFGLSLDLDGFDPNDAPGVGCREAGGLRADAFLKALPLLTQDPLFLGAEIAEFNPKLDLNQKTERLIVDIIELLC